MHQLEDHAVPPICRRDGWTAARRVKFLECLAATRNVSRACAAAGLSREAAYRLRRRDPALADAWRTAWDLGHEARARTRRAGGPERPFRTVSQVSNLSTSPPGEPASQSVGAPAPDRRW